MCNLGAFCNLGVFMLPTNERLSTKRRPQDCKNQVDPKNTNVDCNVILGVACPPCESLVELSCQSLVEPAFRRRKFRSSMVHPTVRRALSRRRERVSLGGISRRFLQCLEYQRDVWKPIHEGSNLFSMPTCAKYEPIYVCSKSTCIRDGPAVLILNAGL